MEFTQVTASVKGLPSWLNSNPPANAKDSRNTGSLPRSGRSLGGGNGNPLQYSCLENSMDRSLAGCNPWSHKKSDMTKHACKHGIFCLILQLYNGSKEILGRDKNLSEDRKHTVVYISEGTGLCRGLKEEIKEGGQVARLWRKLIAKPGRLDFVLEAIESVLKPLGLSFYSTMRALRQNKDDPFIYISVDLTLWILKVWVELALAFAFNNSGALIK